MVAVLLGRWRIHQLVVIVIIFGRACTEIVVPMLLWWAEDSLGSMGGLPVVEMMDYVHDACGGFALDLFFLL